MSDESEIEEKLESLVDQGLSQTEMAEKLGFSINKVYVLLNKIGLHSVWKENKKKKFEEKKEILEFLVNKGLSQTEMAEKLNLPVSEIHKILYGTELHSIWEEKRKKKKIENKKRNIESLINQGLNQVEIAEKLGMTRQRAQQLLVETNLDDDYKEIRKKLKEEKRESSPQYIQKIKSEFIFNILHQTAKKEGNVAYQKALEYKYIFHKSRKETLEELEYFFSLCYSGEKYTCGELAKKTGFSEQDIGRILRELPEISVPYKLRTRKNLTGEQKEQIKRAQDSKFGKTDIAYFLNIPYNALNNFNKRVEKFYKLASQIYEAQDLEFTTKEIAELTDKTEETIKKYIKERLQIEPEIMEGLETIFQRKFEKPYS